MPMPRKTRSPCLACGKEPRTPSGLYCNNICQKEYEYRQYIRRWKAGLETGNRGKHGAEISRHVRRYMMEKYAEKCVKCGWGCRHSVTGKVPLTIDHIDGNWSRTIEENLDLLCPNCHSLTATYCNLNNGRGRLGRKKTPT